MIGHADASDARGHSESLVKGFSPSTNRVDSFNSLTSTRWRALFGGVLRLFASIVPQGKGARVPRDNLPELIEKVS